ncbi:MAG: hypothetical protein LBT50_08715 [Prevotellaceae bacterium]|nr:hypothetical protein [Prevotellaceae bacterium]
MERYIRNPASPEELNIDNPEQAKLSSGKRNHSRKQNSERVQPQPRRRPPKSKSTFPNS